MKVNDKTKEQLIDELHRYEHIVSSSTDMLALVDKKFVYRAANTAYLKAFDLTPDKLIGNTVPEVLGKEFFETVIKPNAQRCLSGEQVNYQSWFEFPAYEPKYMDVNYYPYLDHDNKVKGFVVNVRDMTERKKAEEALNESRLWMNNVFNSLNEAVLVVTPDRVLKDVNKATEKIFGYSKDELINQSTEILHVDHDHYIEFGRIIKEAFDRNEMAICEFIAKRKNGEIFPSEHTVSLLKDESGKSIGIVSIIRDITERKKVEEKTMLTNQLISIGELAAGVAHEINNPINGIINYAQILLNKSMEGSKDYDLSRLIIKEGVRIADIVGTLLSFACSKEEKKHPVHIHEIMSNTLALMKNKLRMDGIELRIDIPSDLPNNIANPQQIQQVFMNIISNSQYALNQKYQGVHKDKILEIKGKIIIIDDRPYIQTIFYDKGHGIPADIMDKILNPFFTTKPSSIGIGLGLSISHGIINNHGGNIRVDSVEGEFTKVVIELPLRQQ